MTAIFPVLPWAKKEKEKDNIGSDQKNSYTLLVEQSNVQVPCKCE